MDDIRTEVVEVPRDESGGCSRFWPGGVRRKGGMSVALAFMLNTGTSRVFVLVENTGNGSMSRPEGRRREYRMPRTGADWGVLAMKPY